MNMQMFNEVISLCNEVFELKNDCMEAVKYRGKAYLLSGLYDSVRSRIVMILLLLQEIVIGVGLYDL